MDAWMLGVDNIKIITIDYWIRNWNHNQKLENKIHMQMKSENVNVNNHEPILTPSFLTIMNWIIEWKVN